MSTKDFVRSHYPGAAAIHRDAVHVQGQATPVQEEGWIVLSSPTLGSKLLGTGPTEDVAWDAAANTVRSEYSTPKLNFKEWLAEQAKREGSVEERRKRAEEWSDSVANLFATMIRWLAEEDTQRVLTVETGTVEKDEQGIGPYTIAAMRINLSSRFVDLIPVGRNVVGGIGNKGDLGFRAEGRVDMRAGGRKYMLYRIVENAERHWVLVSDYDDEVKYLIKETFIDALQDLMS